MWDLYLGSVLGVFFALIFSVKRDELPVGSCFFASFIWWLVIPVVIYHWKDFFRESWS